MPESLKTCAVEGCEHTVQARGLCPKHLSRLARHGDPMGGGTFRDGRVEKFIEDALEWTSFECLTWPFFRDGKGYGRFNTAEGTRSAHVAVCTRFRGPRPSDTHEAAHSCGKGHEGCINPHHLYWATRSENARDKNRHGTMLRGSAHPEHKLTDAQVREIKELRGAGVKGVELSRRYGVSEALVSRIVNGSRRT